MWTSVGGWLVLKLQKSCFGGTAFPHGCTAVHLRAIATNFGILIHLLIRSHSGLNVRSSR